MKRHAWWALWTALVAGPTSATEATWSVDARQPPAAPREGLLRMGQSLSPQHGHLKLNDRYLSLDGRPVIPVMGEFHYSRFPRAHWEEQLLKLKAAGVTVVASYAIWRHHEGQPGVFDWSGDRDLRHFVLLAQRHGLLVFLRPGPWVHAELRFGGLPDWVVQAMPTRRNDPQYLQATEHWFAQVAAQLRGLLWKDGGPVMGLQIENEYNREGALQGPEHIAELKRQLLTLGLDVPLYTVTGWDNAVWPRGEVVPVFGSYVDEPWSARSGVLPAKTSYLFQFGVRNEQGLGAQGRTSTQDHGARDADITPFLGAEYGAGVPQMYRRRPLIAPQDIAAMVVTKLGSGVNLLGYYMFQGGQNPPGEHEETVASGGHNDVPQRGYDFQAPLGQYGQASPVLHHLRPLHLFLQSWGDVLAPMVVAAPQEQPRSAGDLQTLRWAVRSHGRSGFLFVNNHVRQHTMATHEATRWRVHLQHRTLWLPTAPVKVAPGEAFIWPLGLDLGGVSLLWATAQPLTTVDDAEGRLHVFSAADGAVPEFVFDAEQAHRVQGAVPRRWQGQVVLNPAPGEVFTVTNRQGQRARAVFLPASLAQQVSRLTLRGRQHLVWSAAHSFATPTGGLALRQHEPVFRWGLYPQPTAVLQADGDTGVPPTPQAAGRSGLFYQYNLARPRVAWDVQTRSLRAPGPAPAPLLHGPRGTVVQPKPEAFAAAAAWSLGLPAGLRQAIGGQSGLSDVFLDIDFEGDFARLFDGPALLDDSYFIGRVWRVGLKRYVQHLDKPLTLAVMPLREDHTVSLDPTVRLDFQQGQAVRLNAVRLVPEYALTLH